jgi:hypothetical protein
MFLSPEGVTRTVHSVRCEMMKHLQAIVRLKKGPILFQE